MLQIQNVGVGHASLIYFARTDRVASFVSGTAGSANIHAAFGGALAFAALLVRRDICCNPFIEHALGNCRQSLTRASGN
jgi:hypothetical protein